MWARLLGPVSAETDGVPMRLGCRKQRALFALLALQVNTLVALDRLVDELWRNEPPAQATLSPQSYIFSSDPPWCVERLGFVSASFGDDATRNTFGQLTPQEVRIALFASSGASNARHSGQTVPELAHCRIPPAEGVHQAGVTSRAELTTVDLAGGGGGI
jgi:hypothetical protein